MVTLTLVFLLLVSSSFFSWILKPNFVLSELGAGMFFEALSALIFLIGIDLALGGSMCIQHLKPCWNSRQSELEGCQRPSAPPSSDETLGPERERDAEGHRH